MVFIMEVVGVEEELLLVVLVELVVGEMQQFITPPLLQSQEE